MKSMRYLIGITVVALAALGFAGGPALADDEEHHHGDIGIDVQGGSLLIGSIDELGFNPSGKVFAAEIDTEITTQYWITGEAEPGYDAVWEDNLVGYNFGIAFVEPVKKWNGSGFVSTVETMRILNPSGPEFSDSGSTTPGWWQSAIDDEETWHLHPTSALLGPDVSTAPADGIYLALLKIKNQEGVVGDSDIFAIVYNKGMGEEEHEAAIEWVNTNVVPEPASILALLAGTALVAMRRKKA